ncbi:MAG: AEC family transporter [Rhodoferax sp.]|nr:AEC family transporter [Rhodoferax sp.]MCM2296202.1 AEC family transporter [Rhodoferax sp.]
MMPILAITGPIYMAIALGYATTRGGLFTRADMRVFGQFVIKLALPAMLFNALSQRQIGEILNASYVLAYLAGTLVLIALGLLWGKRKGLGPTDSVVVVMGMTCSNSGFVGYPILLLLVAPVAAVALALNMLIENLLVIPLLLALAERSRGEAGHWTVVVFQSLKRLAVNPLIIGLAAGVLVSVMRWQLPEPVLRAINLFALSSAGLSLFVIGGTLVGLPLAGLGQQIMPIAFGKLVLHPLAVFAAVMALPMMGLAALEPSLRMAAVLLAAMPMMGIYPILAQSYGKENLGAAALLVTTMASFFSLSCLIWLLG